MFTNGMFSGFIASLRKECNPLFRKAAAEGAGQNCGFRVVRRKPWFFGDFSGTVSRIPRMPESRRVPAPPPLREGGRGHGWDVHAWKKKNARDRDGGSTALGRLGMPFPFAPKAQSHCRSFLRADLIPSTTAFKPLSHQPFSTADAQKRVPPRGERIGRVALPRDRRGRETSEEPRNNINRPREREKDIAISFRKASCPRPRTPPPGRFRSLWRFAGSGCPAPVRRWFSAGTNFKPDLKFSPVRAPVPSNGHREVHTEARRVESFEGR